MINPLYKTLFLKYALTTLFILIGITLCAARVPSVSPPPTASPWRVVALPATPAQPLHPPVVLDHALIWRPLGSSALVYSSLDGATTHRYDWLRGIPLQWSAHTTEDQIYLTWRTPEGVLWGAILSPNGEQQSAPIEYATVGADFFQSTLLPNGLLGVAWRDERSLYLRTVQRGGQSLPPVRLAQNVDDFSLTPINGNTLFIAWRDGAKLFLGEVPLDENWQALPLTEVQPIPEFSLAADAWLASLVVFHNDAQRLIVWGIGNATHPSTETFGGVWLPLQSRAAPQFFTLLLPNNPPLRWAGAGDDGRLVLAARLGANWQPVRVEFGATGAASLQMVDGAAQTGGAAAFKGDHFAWVTLNPLGEPLLYATTLDPRFGVLPAPSTPTDWQATLRRGLGRSPYLLLWLILPVVVAWLLRGRSLVLPAVVAAYWLSKLILPLGVFASYPTLLGRGSPFLAAWVALFLISRVAAMVAYIGWGNTPATIRHAAYFLTDAALTFAIFGAAVE